MARVLSGILGVLIIIGGIYCVMAPAATFLSLVWIIGIVMLADGISNVVVWAQNRKQIEGSGWLLAGAIISIIFGIVLLGGFYAKLLVGTMLIYIIAFWFIIGGILRIASAFKLRKMQNAIEQNFLGGMPMTMGLSWGWVLVFGILMTLFGILSLCSPLYLASFVGIIVGLAVVVAGINLVGFAFTAKK